MGVGPAIQMLDAEEKSRLAGAKVEPGPSKRPLCRKKTRRSGRCGERKKIEKERDETEKKRGTGIGAQSWTVVTMSTNERRSIKSRAEKGRDRLRTCALKGEDSEVSAHPIRSSSDLRPAARADGSFCQANEFLWGPPPFLLCVCVCVCVCCLGQSCRRVWYQLYYIVQCDWIIALYTYLNNNVIMLFICCNSSRAGLGPQIRPGNS